MGLKHVLSVTSGLKGTGIVDEIKVQFEAEGLAVTVYDKVESNPKDYNVMDAYQLYTAAIENVIRLARDLGIPENFSTAGPYPKSRIGQGWYADRPTEIKPDDSLLNSMAEHLVNDLCTPGNPRTITVEGAAELLRDCAYDSMDSKSGAPQNGRSGQWGGPPTMPNIDHPQSNSAIIRGSSRPRPAGEPDRGAAARVRRDRRGSIPARGAGLRVRSACCHGGLPGDGDRVARPRGGPGRRREDRAREGARGRPGPQADPPAVLRGFG
jgi:hypothetical protein